jgi:hypothetical protein
MTMPFLWSELQNGSDIRGVAMPGIPGETVDKLDISSLQQTISDV